MAKNLVQFQPGISLHEFISKYGTETQCYKALYNWRWPNGFKCPECWHDRYCTLNTRKFPHKVVITGGDPASVQIADFKWVNTAIGNVKRSFHGTFHSISKKHFERYLAEFCYRFNRRFDLRQLISRFTYVALRTPPMPQRLLKVAEHFG